MRSAGSALCGSVMVEHGSKAHPAVAAGDADHWTELVQRLREGDRPAEEEICTHFYPRILGMATFRLRDPERALEVAQETMLAILPALRNGQLRDPEKLPGFIFGTSRNLINNVCRSRSQMPTFAALPEEVPAPLGWAEQEQQARDERRRAIRLVLAALKPLDRKILLLTLIEGMNPREIAPIVDLTAEVVRTRKARAIRALLQRVKEMSRNDGDGHK